MDVEWNHKILILFGKKIFTIFQSGFRYPLWRKSLPYLFISDSGFTRFFTIPVCSNFRLFLCGKWFSRCGGRSNEMFFVGWCYIAIEMVLGLVILVQRLNFSPVMIFKMVLSFPNLVFGTIHLVSLIHLSFHSIHK